MEEKESASFDETEDKGDDRLPLALEEVEPDSNFPEDEVDLDG